MVKQTFRNFCRIFSVKSGSGKPVFDNDAVLTFIYVTDGFHEVASEGWAVTLEVEGTVYEWDVTDMHAPANIPISFSGLLILPEIFYGKKVWRWR